MSTAEVEVTPGPLTGTLRSAVADAVKGGLRYAILARIASINDQQIRDFIAGKRDTRLKAAGRIAGQVGVKLVMAGRSGTLTEVLLSAIDESGLNPFELGRAAGMNGESIRRFVLHQGDLLLSSVDKLLAVLPLKVVREAIPGPPSETIAPDRPFTDALIDAIKASGMTPNRLAKACGLCPHPVYDFVRGKRTLTLQSADAIAVFLQLRVVGQDSDASTAPSARPFTDGLLEAIKASGMNAKQLFQTTGVERMAARRFLIYERSLLLDSADKFAVALKLKVVRPDPADRPAAPPEPDQSDLLEAIGSCGKDVNQLARASGVPGGTIRRFLNGTGKLRDSNALKLRQALAQLEPAGPIPATPEPATNKGRSTDQVDPLSQARPPAVPEPRRTWPPGRCPVSFGADGRPIAGQPKKVTHPQLKVIRALVDAGPDGLTGEELLEESGCGGYRNIFGTLARDQEWRARIRMAGNRHEPYRLAMPGDR